MRSVPLIVIILFFSVVAYAADPVIIEAGVGRNWTAIKILQQGDAQLEKGDLENARRTFDAAIRSDPTLWPAYHSRAKVFIRQRKWQLAMADCNEVLRQDPTFIPSAILRAHTNIRLGNYAAALKELDHVIRIRPRAEFLTMAFNERAWFRATCPDASFRNGRQAVEDARKACNITSWKDADPIDTLAIAYAEAGDFDSALRFEQRALRAHDAGDMSEVLQEHLAMFKQRRPLRSVSR